MVKVFLALGSNIEPRQERIEQSLGLLKQEFQHGFIHSRLYLTQAYPDPARPGFINCCAGFETDKTPEEVLNITRGIEQAMGRSRIRPKGEDRTMDIDIVLFGSICIHTEDLRIPHHDLGQRDFFLVPLLELDEGLRHPENGRSLKSLLAELDEHKRTNPKQIEIDIGAP